MSSQRCGRCGANKGGIAHICDPAAFEENIKTITKNMGGDDKDVSDWMDSYGCCKICGGEIPYGHQENCVIYSYEKRIKELEKWNAEMVEKAAGGGTLDGYREMADRIAFLEQELKFWAKEARGGFGEDE